MLMDPPRRRVIIGLIALGIAVLGCGGLLPSAPSNAAPDGGVVSDPVACAITTPPGPNDRVPEPGEMDVSDIGNGRWRLCLDRPATIDVEGSAWCTWNEARTVVDDVAGLPIGLGPESTVDGGVSISRFRAYLSSNSSSMVGSWEGGPVSIDVAGVRVDDDPRGSASFVIPQTVDPDHPPAVRPPDAAGVIAWQCGDPPPPG